MRREKESLLSIVFPYPNAPDGYYFRRRGLMLSTRNENEVWVQSGVVCLIVSFRVFGLVTTTIANVRERRERIGDERANVVRRPSFPARLPRY